MLAIIDRSDEAVSDLSQLSPQDFYAFADAEDKVHLRWSEVCAA